MGDEYKKYVPVKPEEEKELFDKNTEEYAKFFKQNSGFEFIYLSIRSMSELTAEERKKAFEKFRRSHYDHQPLLSGETFEKFFKDVLPEFKIINDPQERAERQKIHDAGWDLLEKYAKENLPKEIPYKYPKETSRFAQSLFTVLPDPKDKEDLYNLLKKKGNPLKGDPETKAAYEKLVAKSADYMLSLKDEILDITSLDDEQFLKEVGPYLGAAMHMAAADDSLKEGDAFKDCDPQKIEQIRNLNTVAVGIIIKMQRIIDTHYPAYSYQNVENMSFEDLMKAKNRADSELDDMTVNGIPGSVATHSEFPGLNHTIDKAFVKRVPELDGKLAGALRCPASKIEHFYNFVDMYGNKLSNSYQVEIALDRGEVIYAQTKLDYKKGIEEPKVIPLYCAGDLMHGTIYTGDDALVKPQSYHKYDNIDAGEEMKKYDAEHPEPKLEGWDNFVSGFVNVITFGNAASSAEIAYDEAHEKWEADRSKAKADFEKKEAMQKIFMSAAIPDKSKAKLAELAAAEQEKYKKEEAQSIEDGKDNLIAAYIKEKFDVTSALADLKTAYDPNDPDPVLAARSLARIIAAKNVEKRMQALKNNEDFALDFDEMQNSIDPDAEIKSLMKSNDFIRFRETFKYEAGVKADKIVKAYVEALELYSRVQKTYDILKSMSDKIYPDLTENDMAAIMAQDPSIRNKIDYMISKGKIRNQADDDSNVYELKGSTWDCAEKITKDILAGKDVLIGLYDSEAKDLDFARIVLSDDKTPKLGDTYNDVKRQKSLTFLKDVKAKLAKFGTDNTGVGYDEVTKGLDAAIIKMTAAKNENERAKILIDISGISNKYCSANKDLSDNSVSKDLIATVNQLNTTIADKKYVPYQPKDGQPLFRSGFNKDVNTKYGSFEKMMSTVLGGGILGPDERKMRFLELRKLMNDTQPIHRPEVYQEFLGDVLPDFRIIKDPKEIAERQSLHEKAWDAFQKYQEERVPIDRPFPLPSGADRFYKDLYLTMPTQEDREELYAIGQINPHPMTSKDPELIARFKNLVKKSVDTMLRMQPEVEALQKCNDKEFLEKIPSYISVLTSMMAADDSLKYVNDYPKDVQDKIRNLNTVGIKAISRFSVFLNTHYPAFSYKNMSDWSFGELRKAYSKIAEEVDDAELEKTYGGIKREKLVLNDLYSLKTNIIKEAHGIVPMIEDKLNEALGVSIYKVPFPFSFIDEDGKEYVNISSQDMFNVLDQGKMIYAQALIHNHPGKTAELIPIYCGGSIKENKILTGVEAKNQFLLDNLEKEYDEKEYNRRIAQFEKENPKPTVFAGAKILNNIYNFFSRNTRDFAPYADYVENLKKWNDGRNAILEDCKAKMAAYKEGSVPAAAKDKAAAIRRAHEKEYIDALKGKRTSELKSVLNEKSLIDEMQAACTEEDPMKIAKAAAKLIIAQGTQKKIMEHITDPDYADKLKEIMASADLENKFSDEKLEKFIQDPGFQKFFNEYDIDKFASIQNIAGAEGMAQDYVKNGVEGVKQAAIDGFMAKLDVNSSKKNLQTLSIVNNSEKLKLAKFYMAELIVKTEIEHKLKDCMKNNNFEEEFEKTTASFDYKQKLKDLQESPAFNTFINNYDFSKVKTDKNFSDPEALYQSFRKNGSEPVRNEADKTYEAVQNNNVKN